MERGLLMKHFFRLFSAAVCAALVLSLCACAAGGASSATVSSAPDSLSAPASSSVTSSEPPAAAADDGAQALSLLPADAEVIQPDAVPDFLTADQQALYRAAYYLYYHFSMTGGFFPNGYDTATALIGDNGQTFYRDDGFSGYAAFRAAMDSAFTEDYTNSLLNEYQTYMDDGNDALYSAPGDRGGDILYVRSEFTSVSETADEICFQLIGHYDEAGPDSSASSQPYTEAYDFKLVNTENGWRFASFALAY